MVGIMKITFISDTHAKHNQVTSSLPGGDVLIHAGDISNKGYRTEIQDFIKWFSTIENYTHKIFIAGNHDFSCQDEVSAVQELLRLNPGSEYLYDDMFLIGDESADYDDMVKVWGSPWQPEFYNWAFNLPRQGAELKEVWNMIPSDVDILITHGPPYGHLDYVTYSKQNVGCELLRDRIHVFGHIHSSYGYKFDGTTHFFNAAVLDERYNFTQKPLSVEWDPKTNELNFVE